MFLCYFELLSCRVLSGKFFLSHSGPKLQFRPILKFRRVIYILCGLGFWITGLKHLFGPSHSITQSIKIDCRNIWADIDLAQRYNFGLSLTWPNDTTQKMSNDISFLAQPDVDRHLMQPNIETIKDVAEPKRHLARPNDNP